MNSSHKPASQLVWLITGTTSGFGLRLTHAALARGDKVIATGRSSDKLQTVFSSVAGTNDDLRLLALNVTSGFEAISAVVDEAVKVWGRIDVLVNNAGNGYLGLIEESGSSLLKKQFDTNVFAVIDVTNAVLPHMRAKKQGTIVVVGSRSVWRAGTAGLGAYAASKAAIHALTEALAAEVAPIGIRVLLLSPGAFRTEGIYSIPFHTDNAIPDYDSVREAAHSRYMSIPGNEEGDPMKAMEAVVDIAHGEGIAKGKSWPGCLPLGKDAERDLKATWEKHLLVLEEWGDVVRGVGFES